MKEYVSGVKSVLDQYTLGTSEQLLAFYNKAQVSGPDASSLIALSGGSVVSPGDSMTPWVNATTHKPARVLVAATFQGSPITLNATFNTLSTGLNYMNYADIQIPAKSLEIQVSNFNYNRNN